MLWLMRRTLGVLARTLFRAYDKSGLLPQF